MKIKQQERNAIGNFNRWQNGTIRDIRDAYAKPSYRKINAWDYCERLCAENHGHDLKVISKNTCFFTAGFTFMKDGREHFMYITANYDVAVEVTREMRGEK